eukprot:scaffold11829_cov95-Isochrysis_galbana.AAC.1
MRDAWWVGCNPASCPAKGTDRLCQSWVCGRASPRASPPGTTPGMHVAGGKAAPPCEPRESGRPACVCRCARSAPARRSASMRSCLEQLCLRKESTSFGKKALRHWLHTRQGWPLTWRAPDDTHE